MTMSHDDVTERLPELAGRPLPEDVEAHLRSCDACLARHDAWAAIRDAVALPEAERVGSRRPRALAALAAAAEVTIALAVVVRGGDATTVVAGDPQDCDLSDAKPAPIGPHPTRRVSLRTEGGNISLEVDAVRDLDAGLLEQRYEHRHVDARAAIVKLPRRTLSNGEVTLVEVPPERRPHTQGRAWLRHPTEHEEKQPLWQPDRVPRDPTTYLDAAEDDEDFEPVCVGRGLIAGVTVAHYELHFRGERVPVSDDGTLGLSWDAWVDAAGRPVRVVSHHQFLAPQPGVVDSLFEWVVGGEPPANDDGDLFANTYDFQYGFAERLSLPDEADILDVADPRAANALLTPST